MQIRKKTETLKVKRIFTGRKEFIDSFWNKYNKHRESMKTGNYETSVLMYYGFGGIGKTALIAKIISEMEERLNKPQYVLYDFTFNFIQDNRSILEGIRNILVNNYKFSFPLFDLALYIFARKKGEDPESPEIKSLISRSKLLSLMLDYLKYIPNYGIASKILKTLDSSIALGRTKSYLIKHKSELKKMDEIKIPAELHAKLPSYFIKDLNNNLENNQEPIVIFLDTYEKLVNEMSPTGVPWNQDNWIRERNGLIENTPKVLWVITGREELKWKIFDSKWGKKLEQHQLNCLNDEDSVEFLHSAGIEDPTLQKGLYKLTNGFPIYLSFCADLYDSLIERGERPELEKFGQNTYELVDCFIRYMDDSRKDIIYLLSLLEIWDDAMVHTIGPKILPNFSLRAYSTIKESSMITKNDELYIMHQTISEILANNYPKDNTIDTFNNTFREAIQFCKEKMIDKNLLDNMREQYMLWFVRFKMKTMDQSEVINFFETDIQSHFDQLLSTGKFETAETLLNLIFPHYEEQTESYAYLLIQKSNLMISTGKNIEALEYAKKSKSIYADLKKMDDLEYLKAKEQYGVALFHNGKYKQSSETLEYVVEKRKEILTKKKELLGVNHPDTILAMKSLATGLYYLGQYEEARIIEEEVISKSKEIFGENHLNTIIAKQYWTSTLYCLGKYKEALKNGNEILSKSKEIFGENHFVTIDSMHNLATFLHSLGNHEKALKIRKEVVSKRIEIFGENHPATITAMHNLADSFHSLGNHEKALKIKKEVVSKRIEIFGENHPATIDAINDLTHNLHFLGKYEEARIIKEEVISKKSTELFGEDHPNK